MYSKPLFLHVERFHRFEVFVAFGHVLSAPGGQRSFCARVCTLKSDLSFDLKFLSIFCTEERLLEFLSPVTDLLQPGTIVCKSPSAISSCLSSTFAAYVPSDPALDFLAGAESAVSFDELA